MMVRRLNCDCKAMDELTINNRGVFQKTKLFFDSECKKGIYQEINPQKPYFTWRQGNDSKTWFATKWYMCMVCGCLWEFQYPDFPANGFVRKFPNGEYHERGF